MGGKSPGPAQNVFRGKLVHAFGGDGLGNASAAATFNARHGLFGAVATKFAPT